MKGKNKWVPAAEITAVIFLAAFLLLAGIIPGWQMQSDFPNYYTASKLITEGAPRQSLYNNAWFQEQLNLHGFALQGKFAPFPPPTALLMIPLTPFDPLTAKRLWLLLNVVLLIPTAFLIRRIAVVNGRMAWLLLLSAGLGLANNYYLGQVYLLILLAILSGYAQLKHGNKFSGTLLWGLAASIKLVPGIFLLPFLLRKDIKALAGFTVGFFCMHAVALLLVGWTTYAAYGSVLMSHLNGVIEGQSPFAYQFQSWNALLRSLFVYDEVLNPNPWIAAPWLFQTTRALIYGAVIFLAARLIYQFRSDASFAEWVMIITGISFFELLPASATYHFLLLLFPFILILNRTGSLRWALLLSFAAIGLLPVLLQKLIPETAAVPLHFYRLWLITIFYLVSIRAIYAVSGMPVMFRFR